jgi:hypothetical protein
MEKKITKPILANKNQIREELRLWLAYLIPSVTRQTRLFSDACFCYDANTEWREVLEALVAEEITEVR